MKKLLSLALVFVIIFTLFGCRKKSQDTESSQLEITQPSAMQTPIIDIQQKPMYAISLVPQTTEVKDTEGNIRFRYTYQNLTLVLPEPEVADKIILDYLSKMDASDAYALTLQEDSLDPGYDSLLANHLPLYYNIAYTPSRFDANILSFKTLEVVHTGGVHAAYNSHATTYSLLTGNTLNLTDILNSNVSSKELASAVIEKLSVNNELWPNYKDIVNELFDVEPDKLDCWYFTDTGLAFQFDPYVLAPFSSGVVEAEIPYSELVGTLKDEYFPAEKDSYSGKLIAEKFTVESQAQFTQFAEVILAQGGTKILLSAEDAITDITIQIQDIASGITNTVMAVQALTPGDALMVEFDASATTLLITYRNGDLLETKNIAYNNQIIIS